MEGFLWLLLQMALLLLAAAVVFFLLGWRWRGHNAIRDIRSLNARIDADSAALKEAQDQRDAANSNDHLLRATQIKIEADLQEANDHRRNLERELIRVHDDLKTARRDAGLCAEDLAAARSALQPAQDQINSQQQQLDQLQKELKSLRSQPPVSSAISVPTLPSSETAPEKPKRTRKPTVAAKITKPAKPTADAEATLTRLEADLTAQQTLLSALRQERDDWQRRVSTLRAKGNDPAGLGLASKSLARDEAQVSAAAAVVQRLQHQQSALRRSMDQASTITENDDLTRIKGIKGVLSSQLHAYGIRTFKQIAEWTDEDVEAFSELLSFKDRAKRDHWVQQAQELGKAPS